MFIRTKTFANKDGTTRTYLQLVANERAGGKVRQRVLANLGRLEELRSGPLDRLMESLAKFSRERWVMEQAREPLRAKWARSWGPALVFRRLWEEIGLSAVLGGLVEASSAQSDFEEAAFAMVLNRLLDPASKLKTSRWLKTIHRPQWQGLDLHHLYRALDFLADHKDEIEPALYARVRDLFSLKLDLVLWDTTSTYFEGRAAEGFAEFGHSKDHRPDRVQIVVGALMSRDGFPIAHEVFPGNTADIDTFRHTLGKVRERFHLGRVILVGDRGMVSEKLLGEIEALGLQYIVGVRMRRLKAAEAVLARAGRYREVAPNLRVKEVVHGEARYIVCLNPEEREHDRRVREEALAKLREKLAAGEAKQLIGNSAYRRYLKLVGAGVEINEAAAEDEARLDGKYVLRTNSSLDPEEVAQAYKSLWQVERAFRELKSGLDLRPVYHWTEKRIRGHVMICFLALVLEMALRRKLAALGEDVPYDDLLSDLSELRAVELHLDGRRCLVRTDLPGQADLAFRAVGLRPPPHITEMPPAPTDPAPECSGT